MYSNLHKLICDKKYKFSVETISGHRLCFIKIDKYNTHNIEHLIDSCIKPIDIEGHIYISHTILNIDNYIIMVKLNYITLAEYRVLLYKHLPYWIFRSGELDLKWA